MFSTLGPRDSDEQAALSASYGYEDDPFASPTPSEQPVVEAQPGPQPDPEPSVEPQTPPKLVHEHTADEPTSPMARPQADIDTEYVNARVDIFLQSLQEPKYRSPLTGDEISELFQAFYRATESDLEQRAPDTPKKTASRTLDAVERGLCTALYTKLLEPQGPDTALAQRFEDRMAALRASQQLLDKLELDISPEMRQVLEPVIAHLSNIDKARAPQDKIACTVQVHKMIADVFRDTSASGDAILPVLVYCVLATPATSIWRHAVFARRYRRAAAIRGQYEYCLTNLEAAVQFLDTVTFGPDDLPQGVDPALFEPRSRASSISRSRANSQSGAGGSNGSRAVTPIRNRIGTLGASVGASVSKYLLAKIQPQQPTTIAEVRRTLDLDSTSVSTGDADSMFGPPAISLKFLNTEADSLTLGEVRQLLAEYKQLAGYINSI